MSKAETETVIKVQNVYKDFRLPHDKNTTIKSAVVNVLRGKQSRTITTQHALEDISFEIKKGEFFGIVGRNGSGKSTMLKMLAGIYQPTKGSINVIGKLVPFIELGVGFNPELTGRENVYLNGSLLGFTRNDIDGMYDKIVKFAEIEKFMDQKLKNYSSGMQVRLAFSMAIRADADILLVDEVLAVGDADFQRKCFAYFRKLKKNKKTVVFVSHDMNAVREYCDKAVMIEESKLIMVGDAAKIANAYTRMFIEEAKEDKKDESENSNRWGDKKIQFGKVQLVKTILNDSDNTLIITAQATAQEAVTKPIFGFSITSSNGTHILGTNSQIRKHIIDGLNANETIEVQWSVPNIFAEGIHYVNIAVVYANGTMTAEWWDEAADFEVYREEKTPYITSPPIGLKINKLSGHK